jgi:hypothetical protein
MLKKVAVLVTLVSFVASVPGCYSGRMIQRRELPNYLDHRIRRVVTVDGEVIEFSTKGDQKAVVLEDAIVGFAPRGSDDPEHGRLRVELENVRTVYVEKFDSMRGALTVAAISSAIVLLLAASASTADTDIEIDWPDTLTSCPFVYSFNGRHYAFEGAPYVGAMCEALEREDLLPLEHLAPAGDRYSLQITGEAYETEHIDEFTLVVVDHPPEVEVLPDAAGVLHTVAHRRSPLWAVDAAGADQLLWLCEKDFLTWSAEPPPARAASGGGRLRDTLYVAFEKPQHARAAKLVVSGGHSDQAVTLERAYLKLWGSGLSEFYEDLRSPAFRARFVEAMRREEVADLAVRVRREGGWAEAGRLSLAGGVARDCVLPLDLEGVVGGTLEVMVAPPAGLWCLNSFGVDYSPDIPTFTEEVAASSAVAPGGKDVRALLASSDGDRCVLAEDVGSVMLEFPVPEARPGLGRSVLAKTRGYYDIRVGAGGPPQIDVLRRFEGEPGYAARFALREIADRHARLCAAMSE